MGGARTPDEIGDVAARRAHAVRPYGGDGAGNVAAVRGVQLYAPTGATPQNIVEWTVVTRKLDRAKSLVLADALGDSPETVIPVHLLRQGLCNAWVSGEPDRPEGAVVQSMSLMDEPWGFGDTEAMWRLLEYATGWRTVDAPAATARALGAVMERETGRPARYYGDVYQTLTRPALRASTSEASRLRGDDEPLMAQYMGTLRWTGSEGFEPIAAGAIVDGRLVGLAHVSAITERHADIGVSTLEQWRGRGFATAAASIVARAIQEGGRTPVWSAGEGNAPSLRVAAKVGFEEVSRRVYVSLANDE